MADTMIEKREFVKAMRRLSAILKVGGGLVLFDFLGLEQLRGDREGGQGFEEGRP